MSYWSTRSTPGGEREEVNVRVDLRNEREIDVIEQIERVCLEREGEQGGCEV